MSVLKQMADLRLALNQEGLLMRWFRVTIQALIGFYPQLLMCKL